MPRSVPPAHVDRSRSSSFFWRCPSCRCRSVSSTALADTRARTGATCRRSRTAPTRKSFEPGRSRRCATAIPNGCSSATRCSARASIRCCSASCPAAATETCMFLLQAASGPAWWYLSFKNHLVAERRQAARDVLLLPRHQPDRHDVPPARTISATRSTTWRTTPSRSSTRSSPRASAACGGASTPRSTALYEVDTDLRVAAPHDPPLVRLVAVSGSAAPAALRERDRRRLQPATSAATSPPTSAPPRTTPTSSATCRPRCCRSS